MLPTRPAGRPAALRDRTAVIGAALEDSRAGTTSLDLAERFFSLSVYAVVAVVIKSLRSAGERTAAAVAATD